jgi:hypothetical protein
MGASGASVPSGGTGPSNPRSPYTSSARNRQVVTIGKLDQ